MISFTIGSGLGPFQAESGMTWFEWINSEYNTIGVYYKPSSGFVLFEYDGVLLKIDTEGPIGSNIIGGHDYTITTT
jgi:hypothetical protein